MVIFINQHISVKLYISSLVNLRQKKNAFPWEYSKLFNFRMKHTKLCKEEKG